MPHVLHLVRELREVVRKEHLFKQADQKAHGTGGKPRERFAPAAKLRGHVAVTDDRPGDEVREKRDVRAEVDEIPLRGSVPPVNIDGIGQGLKRIKGDADGKRHGRRGNRQASQRIQRADQQPGILEKAQHAEVDTNAENKRRLFGAGVPGALFKKQSGGVVKPGGKQHEKDVHRLPPRVKNHAEQKQAQVF